MERMTRAKVEALIRRLNEITGSPAETYTIGADGQFTANPGNFHLEGAYGGHKLARIASPSGGSSDVLNTGFTTWRGLYDALDSYLRALEDVQRGRVTVKTRGEA